MKILLVDIMPLERATYLHSYLEVLKKSGVEYDVFSWDRKVCGEIRQKDNWYIFQQKCPSGLGKINKLKKLWPMYLFRRALINQLKKNKYDRIITINTMTGMLISDFLFKYYKGKYIFDCRDYTYERIKAFKKRVNVMARNSAMTIISSRGFLEFIDNRENILINHNISNIQDIKNVPSLNANKINTIGFVGWVRYQNENIKLIEQIEKSSKYRVLYAGQIADGCNLKQICQKEKYQNVRFIGEFKNSDKGQIYQNIDIINSLYGDSSLEVTTAVPNRYYDAMIYKKPIIASKGTYLGKLVVKNKLGIAVDIMKDDLLFQLDRYIKSFDRDEFSSTCAKLLSQVIYEQNNFKKHVYEFCRGD